MKEAELAFLEKGWSVSCVSLDVADIEAVRQFIEDADPFEILVNSAGLARHSAATENDGRGL